MSNLETLEIEFLNIREKIESILSNISQHIDPCTHDGFTYDILFPDMGIESQPDIQKNLEDISRLIEECHSLFDTYFFGINREEKIK